jgi:phosphatidylserine/phosphatidylglycerophosphate/cardiolipin synthase-like enzyme
MVIDGETVITGSFNFTKDAQEKNAENVLIIRDKALPTQYI